MNTHRIPEYFNIGDACTSAILKNVHPADAAIIVENQVTGTSSISYDQLNKLSNQFAHSLNTLFDRQSSAGASTEVGGRAFTHRERLPERAELTAIDLATTGQRVLLWLPNCLEFPVAFLGCLKTGSVAVPVSVMLTGDEINYMLADSAATVLVTTPGLLQRLESLNVSILHTVLLVGCEQETALKLSSEVCIQNFHKFANKGSEQNLTVTTRADDPAYLVYTSGTTGFPKGVLHAHRALLGRLPAGKHWFSYQSGNDRILHSGKFNWTYVLGTALMDPLYQGKSVVVFEGKADATTWPELIAKHRCTIFIGVPTLFRQILQKTECSAQHVPTLRHCMCAGEHLSDEVLDAWKQRFKLAIYEAIGMSECSYYLSQSTSHEVKAGSAGFPQPGHHIELLDDDMQSVSDGAEGMLCIGLEDPGLFVGYWRLPEETAATRRDGFFLTGDYARRDKDGYFWFLGRKDDIINSFGYRISPMEIERVFKAHPKVADCVAVEESVGKDKNIVSACVILKHQKTVPEHELTDYAKQHLAAYKVPKAIYFVDEFPRTTNGKVIRSHLKDRVKSRL